MYVHLVEINRGGVTCYAGADYDSMDPSLEIGSQSLKLIEHKVDVTFVYSLVGDDASEKVGIHAEWLVADHDGTSVHHPAL